MTQKEAILWQANNGGLCPSRPVKCQCGYAAVKVWKRQPKCDDCFTDAWKEDYLRRGHRAMGGYYR